MTGMLDCTAFYCVSAPGLERRCALSMGKAWLMGWEWRMRTGAAYEEVHTTYTHEPSSFPYPSIQRHFFQPMPGQPSHPPSIPLLPSKPATTPILPYPSVRDLQHFISNLLKI